MMLIDTKCPDALVYLFLWNFKDNKTNSYLKNIATSLVSAFNHKQKYETY